MTTKQRIFTRLIGVTLFGSLVACTGAVKDARDPLENWNRGRFVVWHLIRSTLRRIFTPFRGVRVCGAA